jgi:hypothetical protein
MPIVSRRTVDALQCLDNLAQAHFVDAFAFKAGQDAGAESEFAVQIALGPAVGLDLELGRRLAHQIGIEDAERVQAGDVVASNLVGANEQLNLRTKVSDTQRSLHDDRTFMWSSKFPPCPCIIIECPSPGADETRPGGGEKASSLRMPLVSSPEK